MVYLIRPLRKRNRVGFPKTPHEAAKAEVLRGPEVDLFEVLHSGGKLRVIEGRKADAPVLGWQVAEAPDECVTQEKFAWDFF